MVQCPNCQHGNRDGARFCARCRTELFPAVIGGDYHILSVIDTGGMGRVYKAERQGQVVAVKEIRDTFRDARDRQDAINRFMAEALTLARLSHPNIPVIHRNFVENGRYYLVMDWIDGQDLRDLMEQRGNRPLPEEQVLDWALQLFDVLEYLHGQNPPIIFRDLKPANIILRRDGSLVLVDFGIAKLFAPGQQGTLIGTPGYAAIEQYQGLADPRSDIYALGVTLYYLLTGRDPQQNAPFNFPPARSINPRVSPAMESILQKAMEYRPDDRWATVGDIRLRLQAAVGPPKIEVGTVLSGRYQVKQKRRLFGSDWKGLPDYHGFIAKNLITGTECGVFPLGEDLFVDALAQQFVKLQHPTLSPAQIIVEGNVTCLICERPRGTELSLARIQDNAQLTSVGLQLSSLFQETGARGAGFGWGDLQASQILISPDYGVRIDLFGLFLEMVFHEDMNRLRDDYLVRALSIFLPTWHRDPDLNHWEAAEVQVVGLIMYIAVTGQQARWDFPCSMSELFDRMPGISPALAALVVGIGTQNPIGKPWISSLTQLSMYLKNPPTPASA